MLQKHKKKKKKCVKSHLNPFVIVIYCCLSFLGYKHVGTHKRRPSVNNKRLILSKQKHNHGYVKVIVCYNHISFHTVYHLKSCTLDL